MIAQKTKIYRGLFLLLLFYLIANTIFWFSDINRWFNLFELNSIETYYLYSNSRLYYLGVLIKIAFGIVLLLILLNLNKIEFKKNKIYRISASLLASSVVFLLINFFLSIVRSISSGSLIILPIKMGEYYLFDLTSEIIWDISSYLSFYAFNDLSNIIIGTLYSVLSLLEFGSMVVIIIILFKEELKYKKIIKGLLFWFLIQIVFVLFLRINGDIFIRSVFTWEYDSAQHRFYEYTIDFIARSPLFFWINWLFLALITLSAFRLFYLERRKLLDTVEIKDEVIGDFESGKFDMDYIEKLKVITNSENEEPEHMDKLKIEMFLMAKAQFFKADKLYAIRKRLESIDRFRVGMIFGLEYKNPTTILVVSLLFGTLGIDRFMLGQIGLGILKLITAGGCGLWALIDWFIIIGVTKDVNYTNLMKR